MTRNTLIALSFAASVLPAAAAAQPPAAPPSQTAPRPERQQPPMDPERARKLYVSADPKDHSAGTNFQRDIDEKKKIDERYAQITKGVVDFQKVTYRSSVGDLDIPAYLFQPLKKRGAKGHAAMVWIHGEAFHNEIDYGGYEIDDVLSAFEYLKTLSHVDPDRVGVMGWSHGGYITLFSVFRDKTPFKAAAAIVPVTNLVFRLSYKGPGYQRSFATQKRIQGLPFEKPDLYIQRSPLYSVDKLHVPLLVHVSTNDQDVNFVEDQQIVDALRSRKPDLAETKVYVDPPGGYASVGHTFSRRVNIDTLQREDSPEQIDSWNRVWTFFDWNLRPYEDRSKPATAPASVR